MHTMRVIGVIESLRRRLIDSIRFVKHDLEAPEGTAARDVNTLTARHRLFRK